MNEQPKRTPLTLRRIAIDTYRENVAYMHRACAFYHTEGFQALSKIEVDTCDDGPPMLAVLNIVDDDTIIGPEEIGLSEQAFSQLGLEEGASVFINHAQPPSSLQSVHQKIAGASLAEREYQKIVQDISQNRYSKIEIAAFLVACAETGLEREEVLYLTNAMLENGERLNWGEEIVVDKHCIGGIPGNRTTPLIVSIVAAHGILIPKTSSRAITSPAGTADTMEVVTQVDLAPERLIEIVRKQRGCLAWGGTAELAPVDDILITVERPLALDSPGQLVASILSKKLAAGSTHLIIDIPVGPSAKVKSQLGDGLRLRKLFEYVADQVGVHLEVVITDGRQPIGRGIGPVLEMRDIMQVLECDPNGPGDLREKSLHLAGRILEFDPDVRGGMGYALARDILDSGRALNKFRNIIEEQGLQEQKFSLGQHVHQVCAPRDGMVTAIDNLHIARIARLAGAPMDKGAGVDLHIKLGELVKEGDPLYSIYAEFPSDFDFATQSASEDIGYTIADPIKQKSEFQWLY